jgi:hypothetical protein
MSAPRLHRSRNFGQVDRERIAKIVGEMRQVRMILSRHACALERSSKDLAMVEKITASLLASVTTTRGIAPSGATTEHQQLLRAQ